MKITAIGTQADSAAKVDISKVHGGYFSDPENIERFIEVGIAPIVPELPREVKYVDFGGGQGDLALGVKRYLEANGRTVHAIVADANEEYLHIAETKGLEINPCNIEETTFSDLDLITMRAILHYNSPAQQKLIIKRAFNSLRAGGFLIHQNSSGTKANCELRSALVNIPELGRAGAGDYCWVSEDEYTFLSKDVGFSNTSHVDYAKANSWGPEEQWDRFNSEITKRALEEKDEDTFNDIQKRKKIYLEKAIELIKQYSKVHTTESLQITRAPNGQIEIGYLYPIVVSRK
jgi:hypothetical protein